MLTLPDWIPRCVEDNCDNVMTRQYGKCEEHKLLYSKLIKPSKLGRRGYLYAVECSNGVVKAGMTTNPVIDRLETHRNDMRRWGLTLVHTYGSELFVDDLHALEQYLLTLIRTTTRAQMVSDESFMGFSFNETVIMIKTLHEEHTEWITNGGQTAVTYAQ